MQEGDVEAESAYIESTEPFARPIVHKFKPSHEPTREGDPEQDIPPCIVESIDVSPDEIREQNEREIADVENQFHAAKNEVMEGTSFYKWISSLVRWARRALVVVGLVIGCIVLSQILLGIASAVSMAGPVGYVLASIYTILLLIVTVVAVQLALLLYRLRHYEFDNLRFSSQLKRRESIRKLVEAGKQDGCRQLRQYLIDHPFANVGLISGYEVLSAHERTRLLDARTYLLDSEGLDSDSWIHQYRTRFQSILDRAGVGVVESFARKAGFGTALSRDPILDRIIVLGAALAMFKRLLELYGLRPKSSNSLMLLSVALSHTYLAGQTQDFAEDVSQASVDVFEQSLGDATAKLTEMVGAKVGEGAIHYLLVRRLGIAAIRALAPTPFTG